MKLLFTLFTTWLLSAALPSSARVNDDSLTRAFRTVRDPLRRAEIAYALSDPALHGYPAGHAYALAGYSLVCHLPPSLIKMRLANALGSDYSEHERRYDSALRYYGIALQLARQLQQEDLMHVIEGNRGSAYAEMAQYPRALQCQLGALTYWERKNDTARIVRLAQMVGNTYFLMDRNREALAYLLRAYRLAGHGQQLRDAELLHSMALVYMNLDRLDTAERYMRRSLSIGRALGNRMALPNLLSDMANISGMRGNHGEENALFREALQMAQSEGFTELAAIIGQNIAYAQTRQGHFGAARAQYLRSLASARSSGNTRVVQSILQNLVQLSDTLRQWKSAYLWSEELRNIEDSLSTERYQAGVADAEARYRTVLAVRARDSFAHQSSLLAVRRRQAIQQRDLAIGSGAAALLLLGLIAAAAMRIRNIRSRQREALQAAAAVFEGEQAERIRIARDLHDSIGQHLSLMKMHLTAAPLSAESSRHRALLESLLDRTVDEVRTISHNMLPEDLAFGLVRALESLCRRMEESQRIQVALRIPDALRDHAFDPRLALSLYRIVQEVLSNMLRHSGASRITLALSQEKGFIGLSITDDGRGFDTGLLAKSQGIGWKNIFARVDLLNGRMEIKSERVSGTFIRILIPE